MGRRSPEFMSKVRDAEDIGLPFIDAVKHVQTHYPELQAAERAKAAERDRAALIVANWNATCPPGTRVGVRFVRGGEEYETKTRSAAWLLLPDNPSVLIEGRAGGWGLDFVRVLADGETLPPLPVKGSVAA